jgi:hypothetical protein
VGQVIGSFRFINKFSQEGPSTPVEINNVAQAAELLEVRTEYPSPDSIIFDWDDVPGALSYFYRYLPTGEWFCTAESRFTLTGKSAQPSVFIVEANDGEDCKGLRIIESNNYPYVLLSPKPPKPTGVSVVSNELTYVEFNVPGASNNDQWRIYRSDGLVVRISAGQRIAVGLQPNEDVNGKTFSYRIMQVRTDTWGEVWGEPSEPITVSIRALSAPTSVSCYKNIVVTTISCSVKPNKDVESTLIEYLDFDGGVLASTRLDSNAQVVEHNQPNLLAAAFVRVSALTGRPNEWMRRGEPVTVRVQSRTNKDQPFTAY